MEDIDLDINMERAINIIMNNIAELTKKFSVTKDEKESNELKNKNKRWNISWKRKYYKKSNRKKTKRNNIKWMIKLLEI